MSHDLLALLVLLIIIAALLWLLIWPWFKLGKTHRALKAARQSLWKAQEDLLFAQDQHVKQMRRREEDFAIQALNYQTAIDTNSREHRKELTAANERAERFASEFAEKRKELADARQDISLLRSQVGYVPGLVARIRHDIPKRLRRLWQFLESRSESWPDEERTFLHEELETVMQKIELHLASEDEIQKLVRETLENVTQKQLNDPEHAQPLVSLTAYLRWLVESNLWRRVEFGETVPCRMRGLPMHWDLMLTNVLSNADHYASLEKNGRIVITTRMVGADRVEIDITNDGPHVPAHVRDHLYRLGFTTKENGRGLGLYIAREIARGLGGDILPPENLHRLLRQKKVRFRLTRLAAVAGKD